MPVPDFQSIMLPFLKFSSDGNEHTTREAVECLANEFGLSESEREELLPSGTQRIFENRVAWTKTHLLKAGLIESPRRSYFILTGRGRGVLEEKPPKINIAFLRHFPEYVEFQSPKRDENGPQQANRPTDDVSTQTPEETLDSTYQSIRKTLSQDLLAKIVSQSPAFFEKLVVELLVKMGYGGSIKDAGKAIGKSGDEGIDGTIKEDKLGLDVIYIQAKKWAPGNVVGRPELHKFVGALAGQGAKKGVFITTSSFTKEARDYAPRNETKIVLIDGEELTQLMIDYNLGVTVQQTYEIKRMDNDYFDE
ncbi:restriction endonuclease [Spirosoma luteum]|uniref:restriction endonuclease n=1 Tax=Spirosoma luteum TaxID=431553 RepID=UPI00036772DB|nr:restriction endonuclease [Spirosoma luteum]